MKIRFWRKSGFEPRMDLSDEDVASYFRKNDDVNLSVPLAIIRQVREETVYSLGHNAKNMKHEDLACVQGVLRGLARFESLYLAAIASRDRLVASAGKVK